jgi:hypothetical protein
MHLGYIGFSPSRLNALKNKKQKIGVFQHHHQSLSLSAYHHAPFLSFLTGQTRTKVKPIRLDLDQSSSSSSSSSSRRRGGGANSHHS